MSNIVFGFMFIISVGVFLNTQGHWESNGQPRSILSKFSRRREPRELNTGDVQVVLKLADLSGNIPNPCNSGGTLLHDVKRNTYVCQCPDEYGGRHCEIRTRVCLEEYNACKFYKTSSGTYECRAVQGNGFVCYYYPLQYRTTWCHTENAKNNETICPKNWMCLDHVLGENQGFRCLPPGHIMPPKVRGRRQAEILDKCSCQNGGHCYDRRTCVCLPHFTGRYCETPINYCKSNPCPPNIDCEPVLGGYSCKCPVLQNGHNCERTKLLLESTMIQPRFNYHANQYQSVPSTCLFYVTEVGILPKLEIDFGDGTVVTMLKEDFYPSDKLNEILVSFFYQPIDKKGLFYIANYTYAYATEGLFNISLAAWNKQYNVMRSNYTVRVSSPEECGFSVELMNTAATPDNATVYQRRHSINIHSVSTVNCPGTRLKYLWELFAVPNIFTVNTPEMFRRSSPNVLTQISEYHVPSYTLAFGDYVLSLTVEMIEPVRGNKRTLITWFKVVKDKIVSHITGGNIRQEHETRYFEIDASESYDPNYPSTTMRFKWTCSAPRLEDVVTGFCDNERNVISDKSVLNVNQFVLKPAGFYIFTVKVESIDHDISEQSVEIQVVSEDTELVHIECVQNCLGNAVITTSPMALRAVSRTEKDSINYTWTILYYGDVSVSQKTHIEYYSDANNFVIKPGTLIPDKKYQISVRVNNLNDTTKSMGYAALDLFTYPALTIGFCMVFPAQGYALLTTFEIKCYNFIAKYFPVTYEVFQYRLPKEEPIMIGFGVSPEFFNVTLAAGLSENDYSIALRVYASDSKGNFGFYEQNMTVFPAAVYTNLNDELAIVKKLTLGTGSTISMGLVNQETQSIIQTILSASCSVHTLSQQVKHQTLFRKSGTLTQDAILQEQINTIVQFKNTMVEYLSLCEIRSPTIAKYCSSTLTSILECESSELLANTVDVPYANKKAISILENIVGMLHKMTQQSEDTTVIRTDVLDIGTTILSTISLLLKKPKGNSMQMVTSRRLSSRQKQKILKANEVPLDLGQSEDHLAQQTDAVIESMNNYASLFARYMAPHEDDYLTNPKEDICISIQKTNRGLKTTSLPAYVEVNVSILTNDSKAMYDLQIITMKNNPYWWEKNSEDINFPLIKVDVFNTVKESRGRIARVGASRRHESRKVENSVNFEADLKFIIPQGSELTHHRIIQGSVAVRPTWNYTYTDITVHKLRLRAGGITIIVFDNQGDDALLRVVVKKDTQPDLDDFWQSVVIPQFEGNNLSELQKRSIYLRSEDTTAEFVFYYVGILPHQATVRSLLYDIDPPVPDSFLYENPAPKLKSARAVDYIAYSFKVYDAQCLRWNSSKRKWIKHCTVREHDITESTISCHCNGLSTIGASFRTADLMKTPLRFSELIKFIDNSLVFWFLFFLTICFLGLFAWSGICDRRNKKQDKLIVLEDNNGGDTYCYLLIVHTRRNRGSSPSPLISVILEGSEGNSSAHVLRSSKRRVMLSNTIDYFVLRTPRSLGDVFCVHLWHNNKEVKPTWYIGKVIVHDVHTHNVSVFIFETWLTPRSSDEPIGLSCFRMLNNEVLSWKMRLKNSITTVMSGGYHCWLSMCMRQLPRNNTRRRRVVLGYAHLCVMMALVTAFYPLPEYNTVIKRSDKIEKFTFAWEEVIIGLLAASMAFMINGILFWIAKNVAPAQSYTTEYSSRYVEELVIQMPAASRTIPPGPSSNKSTPQTEGMELSTLYKPGEKQVATNRIMPLRLPQDHSGRTFYNEVIARMGPIQGKQEIILAYIFAHIFLYLLWLLLGVILLLALYFVLFYATFYTWSTGLRYLFALFIAFLWSFAILEPLKVMIFALWNMKSQKGSLVIDDKSRIALYMSRNMDHVQ